jgi:hypothetical protein
LGGRTVRYAGERRDNIRVGELSALW